MSGEYSRTGIEYLDCLKEKRAKEELIPKIAEVLRGFECGRCALCCKNAGIDLSQEESVEMLRIKGTAYFDMLDMNAVRDRLKAPCGMLEGNLCSLYEKRPMACRVYPFAWVQRGLLALYQCQMGTKVTEGFMKFAEQSGFKMVKVEPEQGVVAIGLDGKVVSAAMVPYTLLRKYYESLRSLL